MLACLSNDAETEAVDFTRLEDEEAQIERILIEGLRLKQEVNRLSRILEDSESVKDELMHDNKSLKDALMDLKERELSREAQYEDLISRLEDREHEHHEEEEKSVDSGSNDDEIEESVESIQEGIQEVILKKRKQEREKLFSEVYYTSRSHPYTQDSEEVDTGQKKDQDTSDRGEISPKFENSMRQLLQEELAVQSPYVMSALTEAMASHGQKRERSNSNNTSTASSQTEVTSYDSRGTSTPTKINTSAGSQRSQSSNREIALAQKLTEANTEIYSLKLIVKDMLSNIRSLQQFLEKPLLEGSDKG